jgi:hypothetical protein
MNREFLTGETGGICLVDDTQRNFTCGSWLTITRVKTGRLDPGVVRSMWFIVGALPVTVP